MRGKSDNLFDPHGIATLAEVSAILHRFVKLITSSKTMQVWTMNDSGKWMYYENGKYVTGKREIDGLIHTFNQYGVKLNTPKNLKYTPYIMLCIIAKKLGYNVNKLEQLNNKSRLDLIRGTDVFQVQEK